MVLIQKQTESDPASYPTITGLSAAAAALNQAALWKRLESWIRYRYGERSVEWIVEGPGVFEPPLHPYTIDSTEKWSGDSWEAVTLSAAPIGFELLGHTYRITADVGTAIVPEAVTEAFTRLAEYLADDSQMPRYANQRMTKITESIQVDTERPVTWHAKALHYSGASDLLRAYR